MIWIVCGLKSAISSDHSGRAELWAAELERSCKKVNFEKGENLRLAFEAPLEEIVVLKQSWTADRKNTLVSIETRCICRAARETRAFCRKSQYTACIYP